MISDQNIAQLLEMGFTQEQAQEALIQSNNDVEQALAYLFNDAPLALAPELESLAGPPIQENSNDHQRIPFVENIRTQVQQIDSSMSDFLTPRNDDDDGVNNADDENVMGLYEDITKSQFGGTGYDSDQQSNLPPVLPQRPDDSRPSSNSKNIGGFIDDDLKETLSSYVEHGVPPNSALSRFLDYNIFNDVSKYLRPEYLPPVLLPGMRNLFEAYFAPLLMILHEVTSFRNAILENDFQNYGYSKDWFKGERIAIGDDCPSRLILETQRLFAFLDGDSDRFFASIKNLTESLPLKTMEEFERVETTEELMNCLYSTYTRELNKTKDLVTGEVESLFHCKFYTSTRPEVNASCFPIEFEQIRGNMYQALHNIIIGENMELANAIDIFQFSDVITIPISPPEELYNVTTSQGISVPQIFYPQIYSKAYSDVYKEVVPQLAELTTRRQQVAKSRQTLTSFRGQKVVDALRASLEALNSEIDDLSIKIEVNQTNGDEKLDQLSNAAKDLEQFCQSFNDKVESLRKEWFYLNQEIDSFDLSNEINSKMANSESAEDAYILIGAIFDESNFYYLTEDRDPLTNHGSQWIRVQYSNANFHLASSSFDEVERHVRTLTSSPSDFSTAIVLIYSKKDCWNNSERRTALPNGLIKFLAEDKAHLHDMLRYIEEDLSNDSLSNEEEDEIEEYVESINNDNAEGFHKLEDVSDDLIELDSPNAQLSHQTVRGDDDDHQVVDVE